MMHGVLPAAVPKKGRKEKRKVTKQQQSSFVVECIESRKIKYPDNRQWIG